jgi:subtilisin-like proprotein convertase family protein
VTGVASTAGAGGVLVVEAPAQPMRLLSQAEYLEESAQHAAGGISNTSPLQYRLSNTKLTAGQLARNDRAILLENAFVDTGSREPLSIPEHLRANGNPGAYIVQARGTVNDTFRAELRAAGADIVSYIPNNAYLVQVTPAGAEMLRQVAQSVMPYEPYYKLKAGLLGLAVQQRPMPEGTPLNVLLFAGATEATEVALTNLGAAVIGKQQTVLGTVLQVVPPGDSLPAIAGLPGVQVVERLRSRIPANDLSRATLGVATDSQVADNYLGLSGTNICVNVNDTGIDTNHPDLMGSSSLPKVFFDTTNSAWDQDGHGTFVAGIIAGTGAKSTTVSNAQGSVMPAVAGQFRGLAPGATLYSLTSGTDSYLQQTAVGRTNVFISNNSWTYGDADYDLAAACYDAAVRDALPLTPGSQPLVYVFPTGNAGAVNVWPSYGNNSGTGGSPDGICSPGTAKNVITVGGVEQKRSITNVVIYSTGTNSGGTNIMVTNTVWLPSTDSSLQVAGFSRRGNVGIGTEGDYGRFKPDVVAPASFIVSTRSPSWDQTAYFNPTNYSVITVTNILLPTNYMYRDFFDVTPNSVWASVSIYSNVDSVWTEPGLTVYLRKNDLASSNLYDVKASNSVLMPGDHALEVGEWYYAVYNTKPVPVRFDLQIVIAKTNVHGDFLTSLSNLNQSIGPYYRYESGTSLAAAEASGTLALMEEFLEQRTQNYFHATNRPSPALMKAMLINGAVNLSSLYDFEVTNSINYQGWGLINLPNSLPGVLSNLTTAATAGSTMLVFDQRPTNVVSTGQRHTRFVKVAPDSTQGNLRLTLAWTDPAGNPMAGIKLVNDLDLIVTNMDTGDVYWGNDIRNGSSHTSVWDTNDVPKFDAVNNVENVYIRGPLGTNYSVTVFGRRVNVNAVTVNSNNVVQDYALVISSDVLTTNGLTLASTPVSSVTTNAYPWVYYITNMFTSSTDVQGGILDAQRAGANSPLLGTNLVASINNTYSNMGPVAGQITVGMSNQWRFYVITNENGWSNAAFLTYQSETLSVPRMGVNVSSISNATRVEADVDLYVTTDAKLTNLDLAAVDGAYKSLSRGGEETIVLDNAYSNSVYYIGVKSEDMEAAEYSLLAIFSPLPFDSGGNNPVLRGFPAPIAIPDGTPQKPAGVSIFAVSTTPKLVQRVIVTNEVSHQLFGDLTGILQHQRTKVFLNNHTLLAQVVNEHFIYDDSDQLDVKAPTVGTNFMVVKSDGPGSLTDFQGTESTGQWRLTMIDNAMGHSGTNESLWLKVDPMIDMLSGGLITLKPGACWRGYVDVPAEVTNLTVSVTLSNLGSITLTVCPSDSVGCKSVALSGAVNDSTNIVVDTSDDPPINADRYFVTICNTGSADVTVFVRAFLYYDINGVAPVKVDSSGVTPILNDAVTYSKIMVPNDEKISSMSVGVRIDHPQVSDLVLHLVSPSGKRILLAENRGGYSTNGMGATTIVTNTVPINYSGGPDPFTNTIDTGVTSGVLHMEWDMLQAADSLDVYYEGNNVWTSGGPISGPGSANAPYGPGSSTQVTVVVNKNGNSSSSTRWYLTNSCPQAIYRYLTFTEDTNVTVTPMKFAATPFAPTTNTAIVFSNTFEGVSVTNVEFFYASNNPIVAGWAVLMNTNAGDYVAVFSNSLVSLPPRTNFLGLKTAIIQQYLPTVKEHSYILKTVYQVASGSGNVAEMVLNLQTNRLTNSAAGWITNTFKFAAIKSRTPVTIKPLGAADVYFDSFVLEDEGGPMFVLPEESELSDLKLTKAKGAWTLEMWDNRAGATVPAPQLLGWELSFIFARHAPQAVPLYHHTPVTNYLGAGQTDYYYVAVPSWAKYCTNWLKTATAGLDVWFNQKVLPTNSAIDSQLMANQTSMMATLSKLTTPALVPGSTYYLAVRNNNATPVGYSFEVDFDVIMLSSPAAGTNSPAHYGNGTPGVYLPSGVTSYSSTLVYGDGPRYFSYACPSNATMLQFRLLGMDGNADMFLRKELPFPDPGSYDYAGKNTGTNDEQVIAYLNGDVGTKAPGGTWYIGVYNMDSADVKYTLQIMAFTNPIPKVVELTNAVAYNAANIATNGTVDYYSYNVTSNELAVSFVVTNMTADFNLYLVRNLPLPDIGYYDYSSENPSTAVERIVVTRTTGPVALSPGYWFMAVTNTSGADAAYTMLVTDTIKPGTKPPIVLTNNVAYSNLNVALYGNPDYYQYRVGSNATAVLFTLSNLTADVNLYVKKDLPLPTTSSFDYLSLSGGTSDEYVLIETNTRPVVLTPGDWYLAVYNASGVDASYQVVASESTAPLPPDDYVTLTNNYPYIGTNYAASNKVDLYRYVVQSNEFGKLFSLYGMTSNVNLVAKKGKPYPSASVYSYGSFAAGTNDELIQVFTNSSPVPLSPGDWFLGVINASGTNNVGYKILVSDYVMPTNIVTLTNGVAYLASSSTTDHYYYEASTNAARVQFEINSPSANMALGAHFGVPFPTLTNFDYFSDNPGTNMELITIVTNSSPKPLNPGLWCLSAFNPGGGAATYSIKATEWTNTGYPIQISSFGIDTNFFCLTWNSVPGAYYYIMAKGDLNESNWTSYAALQATNDVTTYCIPLPSVYHFFRVGEGFATNSPLLSLQPTISGISRSAGKVTIQWQALISKQFRVQWTDSLSAPISWSTVPTDITSANGVFEFIDDGSQTASMGTQRYYRLIQSN